MDKSVTHKWRANAKVAIRLHLADAQNRLMATSKAIEEFQNAKGNRSLFRDITHAIA
ncbi:MAG TPA: hypothetical protein IGS17_12860 [Oscillatoriales cyanobacterium M59_W2019_021]|nr:hypothetical protein [Oscillatoriales cyanobacterium M4454_W2019_049]HIK51794.1 hypothetical protein [Oscillatoriales cyanobacterium M59_W2019_021]